MNMKEKVIQGYRVSDVKVGEGAFGSVYLGYAENGERLAVKIISREQIDGRMSSFLHNEIHALKACQSEHIVKFIDIKKSTSCYYVFLEYCEGGDLAKYIKTKGRIPEKDALQLFYQIIKGFRTIVKRSLIHRDLKPANIFLKDGKVKIGDFGLAKLLTPNSMTATFAGSPYNMAPEILQNKEYDSRADIYSIGTVLYEMIFGSPPFVGGNLLDITQQIKLKRFNKFQKGLISKETGSLLAKLLKENPQQRIDWEQLFNYETRQKNKQNARLYMKYQDFITKINSNKLSTIPSIFCLLNTDTINPVEQEEDMNFIDLNLSSTLFVNLIKSTCFQEEEDI